MTWRSVLTLLSLGAALGCGGGDDGDGGRLSAREEENVRRWVREIGPVITQVSQIDFFTAEGEQVTQTMRRLENTRPPMVSNNVVDRAMREFHGSLAERARSITALYERMNQSIGLLTDFGALEQLFSDMETSANRVRNLASNLSSALLADFQDDPAFTAEIQGMANMTGQLFGGGGGLFGGSRLGGRSMRTMPPPPPQPATAP